MKNIFCSQLTGVIRNIFFLIVLIILVFSITPAMAYVSDVTLNLTTDKYGSETSWELKNAGGSVLYSGSGYSDYSDYTQTFVLSDGDYEFIIYDSYGDGICCSSGNGSYTLTDGNNAQIVSGGDFSSSETTGFSIPGIYYCTSSGSNNNYEWIAGVHVGTINNTSGASGYSDFTSQILDVLSGDTVSVSLTPGFSDSSETEYWKVWIDYNQDGDFEDSGETVLSKSGSSTVSGSFVVRELTEGETRMRVSMSYGEFPPSCDIFSYGEVEDYTVNIGDGQYCTSSSINCNLEWIAGVHIGTLSNTSGASGYTNFTYKTLSVSPNESITVTLTPDFSGDTDREFWKVWIDYNQDGDFEDSGEEVFSKVGKTSVSGSFTVPTSAKGVTRMRVTMSDDADPSCCGTFTDGEVEDYTVNIGDGQYCTSSSINFIKVNPRLCRGTHQCLTITGM